MAEENNPSPEELRRRIQERLEKMKQQETSQSQETPKAPEPKEEPKAEPKADKKESKTEPIVPPKATTEAPKSEDPSAKAPEQKEVPKASTPTTKPIIGKKEEKPVSKSKISSKSEAPKTTPLTQAKAGASDDSKPKIEVKNQKQDTPEIKKPKFPTGNTQKPSTPEPPRAPRSSAEKTEDKKGNKAGLVVILIILLLAVAGLFTWKFLESSKLQTEVTEVTNENESLKKQKEKIYNDLKSLKADYDKLETANEKINAELAAKNEQLEEAMKKIKSHDLNKKELSYLRRQVFLLKKSKETFMAQIDSLTNANQVLTKQNEEARIALEETKTTNDQLTAQVTQGKKIKGLNLLVNTYNVKGKETDKAKKISEIETCITLIENPIAEPGEKSIFLRIVSPSGDILISSKDNIFEAEGLELAYSSVGSVFYQNKTLETCIKYSPNEGEVTSGFYDIEIFTDGEMIGSTNIQFK